MKNYLYFIVLAMVAVACTAVAEEGRIDDLYEEDVLDTNLLGLYYGMERDEYGEKRPYMQRDTLLESLEGIKKQEYSAKWIYKNDDDEGTCSCRATLGFYVDSIYPSEGVRSHIKAYIDTTAYNHFSNTYFDSIGTPHREMRYRVSAPIPSENVTEFAHRLFDSETAMNQEGTPVFQIGDYRVCFVAHKIYDKDGLVTYMMGYSFDNNGSCGCCSEAQYLTMDKETGRILGYDDIMGADYDVKKLEKKLKRAYKEVAENPIPGGLDEIMENTGDNCAIIDEGILFYYLPYSIGCGAEGEYFLVIDK